MTSKHQTPPPSAAFLGEAAFGGVSAVTPPAAAFRGGTPPAAAGFSDVIDVIDAVDVIDSGHC